MKRYEYRVQQIQYSTFLDERVLEVALQSLGQDGFRFVQLIQQKYEPNSELTVYQIVVEREVDDNPPMTKSDLANFLSQPIPTFQTFGSFTGFVDTLRVGGEDSDFRPEEPSTERQIIIED